MENKIALGGDGLKRVTETMTLEQRLEGNVEEHLHMSGAEC
jgi:hypothetical protein